MKINIVAVGKIKEKYLKDGIDEYAKRLKKYLELNIFEISEAYINDESSGNTTIALKKEAELILKKIESLKNDNTFICVLDINGIELSTIDFANKIRDVMISGTSNIIFVIGGSYGLDDSIKKIDDFSLSFSKLTFPHQLFRMILLEQIYRAFKINHNEPYHK